MLIHSIASVNNRINNQVFQGKNIGVERFFDTPKFKEELSKIKTNKDAKKLFLSLSVLAGSVLAELTNLSEKTPDIKNFADRILNNLGLKDNNKLHEEMSKLFATMLDDKESNKVDYSELFIENPKRADYLKVLENYPNLHKKYEEMLSKRTTNPNDITNKFTIETLEIAFELMTKDNRLQYYETYFETLDTNYADRLDDVALTIINAYKNKIAPLSYLHMLNDNKITPEEVTKWANAKNLEYDEFLKCKFLDDQILTRISNLKENNKNFKISSMRPFDKYIDPLYSFKLKFGKELTLQEKLKTVADVHSAIYGPILLNDEQDVVFSYMNSDIRTELFDNIVKDKKLDSVFSFVKYISPEAFKNFTLTNYDVKKLPTDSETYKQIKDICSQEIMNLHPEDPRLFDLYELMQNDNIFGNLFSTTHSRLRFITRFVLKNNPNPKNISYSCNLRLNMLKKELNEKLDQFSFICYAYKRGYAPQFFHYNSKLGNNIKITLNASGNIHTIYEDNKMHQKKLEDIQDEPDT